MDAADTSDTREDAESGAASAIESLGFAITAVHPEKQLAWRQVEQMHWQAVAPEQPLAGVPAAVEPKGCRDGMVLIEGNFLLDRRGRDDNDEVMFLQNQACSHWLTPDRGVNGLCDKFDPQRWHELSAPLPRKAMRVCMDRYEFPNVQGEFPLVVATYAESEKLCARVGKRLCTESEWTIACEGEEGRPFVTGYSVDEAACNIGILGPSPDADTFRPRFLERTARGIDYAWRGKRSGEMAACTSPFGVQDMIGNVDEWTRSVRSYGYKMILKGGHWGPGRHRCRPQTRGHGPFYIRYDQGLRCCGDAP
jgi:formylglycine-generating enzyme